MSIKHTHATLAAQRNQEQRQYRDARQTDTQRDHRHGHAEARRLKKMFDERVYNSQTAH